MDPFFPEFSCGVMHLLRIARCAWSQEFLALPKNRLGFRRLNVLLEHATLLPGILQQATEPLPPYFFGRLFG